MICDCPALEAARVKNWHGKVKVGMLVTEPEVCRKILEGRFPKLKFKVQKKRMSPSEMVRSASDQ